jgi:endonuclease YncB( thermonuclease family)
MRRATLLVLALCISLSAMGETPTGKVVCVTDSDTITLLVAERPVEVRLAEIDTPERGQPWATRANQSLSETGYFAAPATRSTEILERQIAGRR